MKFKRKILFIVGALFFVTTAVGGVTYYHYAANDVEKILRQVQRMYWRSWQIR